MPDFVHLNFYARFRSIPETHMPDFCSNSQTSMPDFVPSNFYARFCSILNFYAVSFHPKLPMPSCVPILKLLRQIFVQSQTSMPDSILMFYYLNFVSILNYNTRFFVHPLNFCIDFVPSHNLLCQISFHPTPLEWIFYPILNFYARFLFCILNLYARFLFILNVEFCSIPKLHEISFHPKFLC
jgi:hypothetical protein